MASKYFKAGQKVFEYLKPKPKVNKTESDKLKSKLNIAIQKTKGSKAKLKQTLFEIENKQPLTFKSQKGIKTKSNTELKKKADARIKEKKQETKTKHFYAPKDFNKGGRVGLKRGGGKFPDHSGDGKITQKDILMAKGVIPKTKSKSKKKVV